MKLTDHTLAGRLDGRFKSKGDITTSIHWNPKYTISMSICSNLERLCYVSSPNLAWVPGMFQQRLWNKTARTKGVTRWVCTQLSVSAQVYKAILRSFCNIGWVGIWQWQGALQYFVSMSVSGNISSTGTHSLSCKYSAQGFSHFWEELGGDRRAGAESWVCL